MHLNRLTLIPLVRAPDGTIQLLGGIDAPRVLGQQPKQVKFGGGQHQLHPVDQCPAQRKIQHQRFKAKLHLAGMRKVNPRLELCPKKVGGGVLGDIVDAAR